MAGNLQFLGDIALKTETFDLYYGTKGSTVRYRVSSPSLSALISYYTSIIPFGASGKFSGTDGGADRELEIEIPGTVSTLNGIIPELFFDQWEMLTNESSDSIFACPRIVGGSSPLLNYNDKTVLSRLARDGGTISDAVDSCNSDISDGNLTAPSPGSGTFGGGTSDNKFQKPSTGAATQLALEILKGQTEFASPTRVLRHTSYCSASASYNSSVAREEVVYSTANLLTEIGSGWTYNCPYRLLTKISSFTPLLAAPDEAAYYFWGWKKKMTRETVLSNFMMEISTEYELNLWSTIRYATF